MSDAGVEASKALGSGAETLATDEAPSEATNVGSPRRSSRRGSSTVATHQKLANGDDELDTISAGQPSRRRSSAAAPSSGGNDSMGSFHGEGADDTVESAAGGSVVKGGSESVPGAVVAGDEVRYLEVVAWIKEHLVLPGFVQEKHWREEHDQVSASLLLYGTSITVCSGIVVSLSGRL